ncbi:hypothetical protein A8H39_05350 [Paraburkholderia fungorum]|uniref:hypothetical protein n=1 Tax=Paraburkholderia fungorum TaxID=134537 RepID=UPI0004878685|nr:hypothetical protein [Paraburkholderia fungorum]MBB5542832.1 hypothetical protein [Paraburkholderia fungorum]PNE55327.1 hypothetical protein A8H39_05350 [Paraburkholderia fungorum]
MPVVIPSNAAKSQFEQTNFDTSPALTPNAKAAMLGNPGIFPTVSDVLDLAGAPTGSTVDAQLMRNWGYQGADKPPPGLYFFVSHPTWITGQNIIGIVNDNGGYAIYIKDVAFNDAAPPNMGAILTAKIARFCMRRKIRRIQLLAAGGRFWPDERWLGYYAWARYGFDMDLSKAMEDDYGNPEPFTCASDLAPFFPCRPADLANCRTVQDVLQAKHGKEWWKICGNGWFMDFDCSPIRASVAALESYCKEKNI